MENLTEAQKTAIAEKILNLLETARFDKWYTDDFDRYIQGIFQNSYEETHEQMLKDVIRLARL